MVKLIVMSIDESELQTCVADLAVLSSKYSVKYRPPLDKPVKKLPNSVFFKRYLKLKLKT